MKTVFWAVLLGIGASSVLVVGCNNGSCDYVSKCPNDPAVTPDEKTLLHIPAWNFHWQDTYSLREPVRVEAGHAIGVRCRFENTADRYILWGEGTQDEMCLGMLQVALD